MACNFITQEKQFQNESKNCISTADENNSEENKSEKQVKFDEISQNSSDSETTDSFSNIKHLYQELLKLNKIKK